jgi:hypothetical protein
MTTASPLQNRQPARQPGLAGMLRTGHSEQIPAPRALKRVPLFTEASASEDDEFKMNLGDLPRTRPGLHVDGFQSSLTSRVLDLFDRLSKR